MADYHTPSTARLFRTIAGITDPEECRAFFEDLCTIKEIQDMAQRLDTAVLLDQGLSYQKITEKVGVSTATISRVSRCLNYGTGGYQLVIDRIGDDAEKKA